jgi:hypothetical protein
MRVRVQIGPVFIGSAEKVSGGMFAIGHVVEKEPASGCCGWAEERVVVGVRAFFSSGPKRRQ